MVRTGVKTKEAGMNAQSKGGGGGGVLFIPQTQGRPL